MKIWGLPEHGRAVKLTGKVILVKRKDGSYHAQAWPRKRGKSKDPAQIRRTQVWSIANKVMAAPDPLTEVEAYRITNGTIFRPMDFKIMIAYGTIMEIWTRDGRVIRPVKILASEIQTYLDTISTVPGSMLYRNGTEWIALEAGPIGDVLTSNGPMQPPAWATGTQQPVPPLWQVIPSNALATGAQATRGNYFMPAIDFTMGDLAATVTPTAGESYMMGVYLAPSRVITQVLFQSVPIVAATSVEQVMQFGNAAGLQISAGQQLFVALTRTSGSPTSQCGLWTGSSVPYPNLPTIGAVTFGAISSNNPQVGDVPSGSTGNEAIHFKMAA